jgi:gluconate kinase
MGIIHQPDFEIIYNDARLAGLSQYLDELHSAASEGQLQSVTPMTDEELVGWLQEMIYTASETLVEIEQHKTQYAAPHLRLVK